MRIKLGKFNLFILIIFFLIGCIDTGSEETPDTQRPVINLIGENPITLEYGDTYNELGAKSVDNIDGDISVHITGTINTRTLGNQIITYSATDASGNSITTTRVIDVIDTVSPAIVIQGANPLTLEYGSTYSELGAIASDPVDGVLSVQVIGSINTAALGEYRISYTASDTSGNSITATRVVNVIDSVPPLLEALGDNPVTVEYGSIYLDQGANAIDTVDGIINAQLAGSINTYLITEQTITYTATDSSGNVSSVDRTVNVIDTISPAITLIGSENITVYLNGIYTEEGANALDNYDGDITNNILITSTVNTSETGDYSVNYSVVDSFGNSVSIERAITVKELTYDFTFVDSNLRLYESSYDHVFDIDFDTAEEISRTLDVSVSNLSTATEGFDFTLNTSQITVSSGELSASITLSIHDDQFLEFNESIILSFTSENFEKTVEILISDTTSTVQLHTSLENEFFNPMTSVIGNSLHVMGSYKIEIYDLVTNTTTASVRFSPSIGVSYGDAVAYNGESYLYGNGYLYKLNIESSQLDIVSQSPWYSEWTSEIQILNNELYVVGGKTAFENSSDFVMIYNFESAQWRQGTPLNQKRYGAASAAIADKLYIFGGNYSSDTSEVFHNNTWSYITSNSLLGRSFDTAVNSGEFIFIAVSDLATNSTILRYDTVNDTWNDTTLSMPSRNYKDSFMYKGRIYIVGGHDNSGNDNSITSFYIGDD